MSCTLRFPSVNDEPSPHTAYRLLELPPSLLAEIESRSSDLKLCIKGNKSDDAVLCTPNTTYAIRSVVLSNTEVVATSPRCSSSWGIEANLDHTEVPPDGDVVIRDQLREILELVPIMPKLERIDSLLRGDEVLLGTELLDRDEPQSLQPKRRRLTYDRAKGVLRPLSLGTLSDLLQKILILIVAGSYSPSGVPLDQLLQELHDEHAIIPELTDQVVRWFGTVSQGSSESSWHCDIGGVVRQIGLGLLSHHKDIPIEEPVFVENWKSVVGDSFEKEVNIAQLKGWFLSSDSLPGATSSISPKLQYFPSSALPCAPAARFSDLFLTRPIWRSDVLEPYLGGIAKDGKERDKLLLKFCRVVVDEEGCKWYSARAKY
ncbi:uncharacterized protein EI90DRAFT_3145352 [Cantharellus anzutake]|uniref:uncharacterized protein n=1 Tax=Cantharellus anzutake TaxID=1750568 RepID=UPI001905E15E|nr:uncharacterized protein EI90DRAFT_3145352 [Cantharellus anzutake]KAF8332656.1 hypothetical protein EI90DRAFT_3145352 [Cantharellus anzutake]